MGIYIPNMSKPKDCSECILADKHLNGLDKQVQKGAESITVTFWDKDELIINEYDIGDMSKVTDLDLVRCGECKKHGKNSCPMTFTYALITDDNNYCSYAERRDDE